MLSLYRVQGHRDPFVVWVVPDSLYLQVCWSSHLAHFYCENAPEMRFLDAYTTDNWNEPAPGTGRVGLRFTSDVTLLVLIDLLQTATCRRDTRVYNSFRFSATFFRNIFFDLFNVPGTGVPSPCRCDALWGARHLPIRAEMDCTHRYLVMLLNVKLTASVV